MARSRSLLDRQICEVSDLFGLFGDPNRLRIVLALDEAGELNVGEMCDALGSTHARTSYRLMTMRGSGIVVARKVGLTRRYSLSEKGRVMIEAVRALLKLG